MKLYSIGSFWVVPAALTSAFLLGCGGGGGGYSDTAPAAATVPTMLVGTVATGKALSGAAITILDSAGRSKSATAAIDGSYAADVSDLVAPLVLKARGEGTATAVNMVSVIDALSASKANVANITPLTTAIAAQLSSTGLPDDLSPVMDRDRITRGLAAADVALQDQIATMMETTKNTIARFRVSRPSCSSRPAFPLKEVAAVVPIWPVSPSCWLNSSSRVSSCLCCVTSCATPTNPST